MRTELTQKTAVVYRHAGMVKMHTTSEDGIVKNEEPIPSCPTIALTADMARALAQALLTAADDIDSGVSDSNSSLATIHISR